MAFDWIESHRGLKDHPKTVTLAAVWRDRKPCVLGHLHALWWWTLEYAPSGVIRPEFFPQVMSYCEWHGKADHFWSGLVEVGFLEAPVGTVGYVVHDWDEYAHRRVERHEKENARKRAWRDKTGRAGDAGPDAPARREKPPDATSGATGPTRARHQPDQQGLRPLPDKPQTPLPPDVADALKADAQGPSGTASAPDPKRTVPRWEEVAPGQHQGHPNGQGEVSLLKVRCPRCDAWMLPAAFEEHVCELVPGDQVQTGSRPGNLGGFLPRRHSRRPTPPEVEEELKHMAAHRPSPEDIAAEAARLAALSSKS